MALSPPFSSLARIFPKDRLVTDPAELRVYECDGLPVHKVPPAIVVLCDTREEVIDVVRWCARERIPFVARGAGTGLSGGCMPVRDAVLLDVNRMRRIKSIDLPNRVAVVEPGVINTHLSLAVDAGGYHYAPDPSSQTACTLGGNIAENSGGPHCLKYGVTSDHVLGLEMVLPDGTTAQLGGAVEDASDLDLVSLFVGSEGTLGVVTEITCRLTPKPEGVRTSLAIFDSMSAACRTVAAITARGILPVALEILDRRTIRAVEASVYAAGYPENAAAVLLIELDGFEAALDEDESQIKAIVRAHGPIDLRSARDPKERAKLWKGRKGAFGAMGRVDTDLYVLDGCVPRTRLEETLAKVDAIAERHGVVVSNVFHAGDGNLHPNISYDGRDPAVTARVLAAGEEMLRACVDAGGTISGEHGIGIEKREFMTMVYDANDLGLQVSIRDAIDKNRLANPGKIFPEMGTWPMPAPLPADVAALAERVHTIRAKGGTPVPVGEGAHPHEFEPIAASAVPVSCAALAGVAEYEPGDFTIGVRAGTKWRDLDRVLAENRQEIPLDLGPEEGGTVGGVVARAASGPRTGRYGTISTFVLGVEGMRFDGTPFKSGGMVVKNVAGYQVHKLLVGSRGRLAFVLRANFKLRPLPGRRLARVATFPTAGEAHAFAARLREDRLEPAAATVLETRAEKPRVVWVFEGNEAAVLALDERARDRLAGRSADLHDATEGERATGVLRWLAGIGDAGRTPSDDLGIARRGVLPSRLAEASAAIHRQLADIAPGESDLLVASDATTGRIVVRWRSSGARAAIDAHLRLPAAREGAPELSRRVRAAFAP